MRVALFLTCVNDTLYPDTGRAVVKLLKAGRSAAGSSRRISPPRDEVSQSRPARSLWISLIGPVGRPSLALKKVKRPSR